MSLEEAIRLIQIHERARQGRLRAKFMKEIRRQEESEREAARRGAPTLDPDVAATRIQKVSIKYCSLLVCFMVQQHNTRYIVTNTHLKVCEKQHLYETHVDINVKG